MEKIGRLVIGHSEGCHEVYVEVLTTDIEVGCWYFVNLVKVARKVCKRNAACSVTGFVYGGGTTGGVEGLVRQAFIHNKHRMLKTLGLPQGTVFVGILPDGRARFARVEN